MKLRTLPFILVVAGCGGGVTGLPDPAPPRQVETHLTADDGVIVPEPVPGDSDGDGVLDAADNCPFTPNADQADENGDGVGDACGETIGDDDADDDGILDAEDNCPFTSNGDQADSDGDGVGDACAGEDGGGGGGCVLPDGSVPPDGGTEPGTCPVDDSDGDGIPDAEDNCVFTYNPDQRDGDGDGIGDACAGDEGGGGGGCVRPDGTVPAGDGSTEPGSCPVEDSDGDGVADADDNCAFTFNPDQADFDGDGVGDACAGDNGGGGPDPAETGDLDADGVADGQDNCTWRTNPEQIDADGDGMGDACDYLAGPGWNETQEGSGPVSVDRDIDGRIDAEDNCPAVPNRFQLDRDRDGVGDVCDPSSRLSRVISDLFSWWQTRNR